MPVGVAEKGKYSQVLGLDDHRQTHVAAKVPQEMAPFTDMAGIGCALNTKTLPAELSDGLVDPILNAGGQGHPSSSGDVERSALGKGNEIRTGGKLHPFTVHSTSGRKIAPVRR